MELLAPCGSQNNFYSAVNYGADAVYLGLEDFSARKSADNFSLESLPFFVAYAHLFGVKVYVTANTLIKDCELEKYFEFIKEALICGVDAFIVQDIFLGKVLKEAFPDICLHLSTQAGVNNIYGAKLAKENCFSRVVLSRECNIREIKEISSFIETEVFVQGAMCSSFSGNCYASSFIGGQSGNRGFCRQPCRRLYNYNGANFTEKQCYSLSLSDMCLVNELEALRQAGVKSIKIEGRMRSLEYTAVAVDIYRKALDKVNFANKLNNLKTVYNRGDYTLGYIYGQDKNLLSRDVQGHIGLYVGNVVRVQGDSLICDAKQKLNEDDGFKILRDKKEVASAIYKNGKILFKGDCKKGDKLFITKNNELIASLNKKRLKEIDVEVKAYVNQKLTLKCGEIEVSSKDALPNSLTRPITKQEICDNLQKTDVYPFKVNCNVQTDESCFVVKKLLNNLRAELYSKVFYGIKRNESDYNLPILIERTFNFDIGKTVISDDFEFAKQVDFENAIFCPNDYNNLELINKFLLDTQNIKNKYLFLPSFMNGEDFKIIEQYVNLFDGLYSDGTFGITYAKEKNKKLFLGTGTNLFNNFDYDYVSKIDGVKVVNSKEASLKEASNKLGGTLIGNVKLMCLEYCPFDKKCGECKRENYFNLTDFANRTFLVRRYKMSSCRFEVLNNSYLLSDKFSNNFVYSLFNLQVDKKIDIIKAESIERLKVLFGKTTVGNYKRGID